VLCRVRPALPSEEDLGTAGSRCAVRCVGAVDDGSAEAVVFVPPDGSAGGAVRSYDDVLAGMRSGDAGADGGAVSTEDGRQGRLVRFDRVLGPGSRQEDVFAELVPLVRGVLRGRSACVIAYGPSGSGKTHTLYGSAPAEGRGIIPRAVQALVAARARAEGGADDGGEVGGAVLPVRAVQASVLEVYNEEVRDLLRPAAAGGVAAHPGGAHRGGEQGATWVAVEGAGAALGAIDAAVRRRNSRQTSLNASSSRGHLIVRLRVTLAAPWKGRPGDGKGAKPATATLAIADLAGSERARDSGMAGSAGGLAETGAVNRSLSALGNVMMALAARDKFVPYRDSALTRCLQPYLAGRSRTVLMVAVSPGARASGLSLRALEFGARVSMVRG